MYGHYCSCRIASLIPGEEVYRHHRCDCDRGHHHRSERVQIRSRSCCLDWSRSSAKLDRRQGQARRHIKTRRSISPAPTRSRSDGRRAPGSAASREVSLDCEVACKETGQSRRNRRRKQDSAHRLGDHEQGRYLSTGGVYGCRLKGCQWACEAPPARDNAIARVMMA
jgi:hypothetical protein